MGGGRGLSRDATGALAVSIERLMQDRACVSSNHQACSLASASEGTAPEPALLAPQPGASCKTSLLDVVLAR